MNARSDDYRFPYLLALACALSVGCAEDAGSPCLTVQDCIVDGHSCPNGQELVCNSSLVCDCESGGGTGGTGGAGAMGGNAGNGGAGGTGGSESCGGDIECTPEAPSQCGTACQEICGGFENFDSAGCNPDNNRCFCTCLEGVCTGAEPL